MTSADPAVADEAADTSDGARPPRAAVLWDMDGTLVDTEPYWFAAEHDLVERFGIGEWSDELARGMIGFDLLDGARYLQRHGGVDLDENDIVDRLLDGVIARLHRKIPWRPGARELLAELNERGVPCALVTMSWRRFVDPVLAALPPGSFVASITGDEVPAGNGKPHPMPYLLGAQAVGLAPQDCVAIEDSPTGVASAVAAGCPVIAVPNMAPLDPQPGVVLIESLADVRVDDLPALIRSIEDAPAPTTRRMAIDRRVLVALAVVTALVAGWWLLGRGDDAPAVPPGAVAQDAWVPYWTLDNVAVDGYDRLDRIRELSPFWYGTVGVDQIVIDDQASEALLAEFAAATDESHIVPSIRDQMPAGGMAAIIADPVQRAAHIATLREFADELDATGIDIDYEQFAFADGADTWETTRPNWVEFVEQLAAVLHEDGRTLTVSIPAIWNRNENGSEGYWVYDHGAIAEHVDAIRIMAYDFSGAEPGPIAPLAWVDDIVRSVSEVVPEEYHDKLVLGIAAFGYNWVESTLGECPDTAEDRTGVTARNALELAERRGGVPSYDEVSGEWWFRYALNVDNGATACVQNRYVQWVDAEGVDARVLLAREAGWGGVSLWALGYDDAEVWSAFTSAATRPLGE